MRALIPIVCVLALVTIPAVMPAEETEADTYIGYDVHFQTLNGIITVRSTAPSYTVVPPDAPLVVMWTTDIRHFTDSDGIRHVDPATVWKPGTIVTHEMTLYPVYEPFVYGKIDADDGGGDGFNWTGAAIAGAVVAAVGLFIFYRWRGLS